jgi:hypothetical protein
MTAILERLDAPPASSGPSHSLVGTWQLTRLALRQDRIILPIWVLVLGLGPSSNAGTYDTIYPMAAERATLTGSIGANPSVAVLYGPAFDLSTAGGYAAWRLGGFMALFVGLMAVFTVTRHTRAEEDTGDPRAHGRIERNHRRVPRCDGRDVRHGRRAVRRASSAADARRGDREPGRTAARHERRTATVGGEPPGLTHLAQSRTLLRDETPPPTGVIRIASFIVRPLSSTSVGPHILGPTSSARR